MRLVFCASREFYFRHNRAIIRKFFPLAFFPDFERFYRAFFRIYAIVKIFAVWIVRITKGLNGIVFFYFVIVLFKPMLFKF